MTIPCANSEQSRRDIGIMSTKDLSKHFVYFVLYSDHTSSTELIPKSNDLNIVQIYETTADVETRKLNEFIMKLKKFSIQHKYSKWETLTPR